MSYRPEYEVITNAYPDLGSNQGQAEHWSAPNRYRAVYDLLTVPLFRLLPNLEVVRSLLSPSETLRIQDCTTGTGQAIIALAQTLRSNGRKVEVTASDLIDPQEIVFPSYRDDFSRLVTQSFAFDASSPPRFNTHFHLSILGYLHPYLGQEQFTLALQNRLAESDVLALIPAGSKPFSPQSARFLYSDERGQLCSVVFDPTTIQRR